MKRALPMLMLAALAGCSKDAGSAGAGGGTPNELAATACEAYARGQLAEKTYQLDHAALAKSLAQAGDGAQILRAPITIDPGLSSESKQTLECTVRVVPGKDTPDVINLQFIW
jgi:hypothetical protein